MKILVACEESQTVCKEFRKKGHEAYSCDLQECSGGYPQWHILGDCLSLLDGNCRFKTQDSKEHFINGKWDMILAFPPCTHLAVSGARHFEKKRLNGSQKEGIEFFRRFLMCDCDKVCIENPVNIVGGRYMETYFPDIPKMPPPTQRIQPWMWGEKYSKTTCLWLKGLEPLAPDVIEKPEIEYFEWVDKKTGAKKRQDKLSYDIFKQAKSVEERQRLRSKTFLGIAKAMAKQWG